jgi:hypothetical protein
MKLVGAAVFCLLFSISAVAQDQEPQNAPATTVPEPASGQNAPAVHPGAITYSDGYLLRAKIHKYASFATLPLFATEVALGQSIYNDPANAAGIKYDETIRIIIQMNSSPRGRNLIIGKRLL